MFACARSALIWPGMLAAVQDQVKARQAFRTCDQSQQKEPMVAKFSLVRQW